LSQALSPFCYSNFSNMALVYPGALNPLIHVLWVAEMRNMCHCICLCWLIGNLSNSLPHADLKLWSFKYLHPKYLGL
jgi:hypothetical protein